MNVKHTVAKTRRRSLFIRVCASSHRSNIAAQQVSGCSHKQSISGTTVQSQIVLIACDLTCHVDLKSYVVYAPGLGPDGHKPSVHVSFSMESSRIISQGQLAHSFVHVLNQNKDTEANRWSLASVGRDLLMTHWNDCQRSVSAPLSSTRSTSFLPAIAA